MEKGVKEKEQDAKTREARIEKGFKEKEQEAQESGLSRYNRRRPKEHEKVEGEGVGGEGAGNSCRRVSAPH
jgi:hypothetical protein